MATQKICTTCGYVGIPKKVTKGNFLTELILWIFFLIPGAFYTTWRLVTKYEACPKCLSKMIIPLDTPKGQELYNQSK